MKNLKLKILSLTLAVLLIATVAYAYILYTEEHYRITATVKRYGGMGFYNSTECLYNFTDYDFPVFDTEWKYVSLFARNEGNIKQFLRWNATDFLWNSTSLQYEQKNAKGEVVWMLWLSIGENKATHWDINIPKTFFKKGDTYEIVINLESTSFTLPDIDDLSFLINFYASDV